MFVGGLLVALLAVGLELILASVQRRITSPGPGNSRQNCLISRSAGYAFHQPHPPVTGGSMSKPRTSRMSRPFGSWSPSASPWPCSPRRCSPGAPAPRPSRSRWASKDFAGAQVLSQAYGQALEAKGYDIELQGQHRRDRDRVRRAARTATSTRTPTTRARCSRTSAARPAATRRRTYKLLVAKLKGTDIVASKPAPAVDVNGFYVTKATAKKYKLKTMSDLAKQASKLTFGGPRPSARSGPSASVTQSQQLYGLEFKERLEARRRADRSRCRRSKTATSTSRSCSPAAA